MGQSHIILRVSLSLRDGQLHVVLRALFSFRDGQLHAPRPQSMLLHQAPHTPHTPHTLHTTSAGDRPAVLGTHQHQRARGRVARKHLPQRAVCVPPGGVDGAGHARGAGARRGQQGGARQRHAHRGVRAHGFRV
eukprot:363786-Chlamydomonas_euryale.AAC.2